MKILKLLLVTFSFLLISCGDDKNEMSPTTPTTMAEKLESGEYTGVENNHAYVDLGLSVKWAACNIGAEYRWGWGSYLNWGCTKLQTGLQSVYELPEGVEAKPLQNENEDAEDYEARLQQWYDKCLETITSGGKLKPKYDAASVNWGGKWRMPTYAEFAELRTYCHWKYTTVNDIEGYMVTGPNGNTIFLPNSDIYIEDTSKTLVGSYWCSTYGNCDENWGDSFAFTKDYIYDEGFAGANVRPVCK